jgi:hypothetical protein
MVLELLLHKVTEAAVIAGLLVFNAGIGLYREGKAQVPRRRRRTRRADR